MGKKCKTRELLSRVNLYGNASHLLHAEVTRGKIIKAKSERRQGQRMQCWKTSEKKESTTEKEFSGCH